MTEWRQIGSARKLTRVQQIVADRRESQVIGQGSRDSEPTSDFRGCPIRQFGAWSLLGSSRGRLCSRPSHTTGRALLHPAVRQRIDRAAVSRPPASEHSSPAPGKARPSGRIPTASPLRPAVVLHSEYSAFIACPRAAQVLPPRRSAFRHLCADTMTSADSCRLSPTSQPGLPSEDGLAAGLPR